MELGRSLFNRLQPDGSIELVPVVSGNSFRGVLRRIGEEMLREVWRLQRDHFWVEDMSGIDWPAMFERYAALLPRLSPGTRLVANAVTLEGEATLAACHASHGGHLLRVDLAEATPLGGFRGWSAARPVVQWSVTL